MAKQPIPKAAVAAGNSEGGGKSKLKMILIIVLALLLVAGASIGATWFLLSKNAGEAPAEHAPAEPAAPVRQEAVYEVLAPAFVVNYKYEGRSHYMQVSVALMARDPVALAALKEHMPILRNRLVMLFSSQDFGNLITPAGKEILRQQATTSVQELAQKEVGKVVIEQVLFTNLVLQ
ncbi:flagellar FliL protein [Azomonas agilis]|uniref:Flagellar protein FliL n=1 Tax=Azomonas agilis TaxID=116849 RepID=A0A562I1X5_9GAMM|nr:flagellar basal body-associated FliL family protein [Azomonas agilis]TWH64952.1 flagellar FliL protein [Azomonas agilis]